MAPYRWLALGFLACSLASSSWLAAQPPRKEEEEEPGVKGRPVVPVPVEPDKKGPMPKADLAVADVGTMTEEAAKAGHPAARDLFRSLSVPYDLLTSTFKGGAIYRVELLTLRDLPEEEFTVKVLDGTLTKTVKDQKLKTGSGFKYTPFELLVLERVEAFLTRETPTLEKADQLDYAARAVAAGLRLHLRLVDSNKRVGKAWEEVGATLKARLLKLQRDRFSLLVDLKEYDKADELGLKLLGKHPESNDVLRDVYGLQLLRTQRSLKDPKDEDLVKLREALVLYERLPGEKKKDLIESARRRLKDRAEVLIAEAKDLDAKKQAAAALAKLRQAEALDPELPAIGDARARLRGKVLYVGVARLPEMMSPARAGTDAERWAVELMFEGLLQAVPDADVVRYRPGIAEGMPAVMPLGRSFTLPRNVMWSPPDGMEGKEIADASDVRTTLMLLRKPGFRERWCSDGLDVFREIDRIDDSFRLRLAYEHGVLEPLARATFKVLPARYLQERGKAADDEGFARRPFGTGPFRYEGRELEGGREVAVFRANPFYGQRPGRFGLPTIREIRFLVPTASTLPADVAAGQLHFYPDAPPDVAARLRAEPALKDVMRVATAKVNRRVHILAVNHRQTPLQNDKLRQGLSAAIDRDVVLKEQFRGSDLKAHVALTGPFPRTCWATPPAARDTPLFKPGAGGLIAEGLAGRPGVKLRLLYCDTDPKNGPVCQLLKTQIERAAAGADGKPVVLIEVMGMPPEAYRNKLYLEHDFDLALTTFDYRDDLYTLGGLLDPDAADRDGRNFLGYLAAGTNPAEADRRLKRVVEEIRQYRDFTKQVKEKTWDLHGLCNQRVPFIPLWQLDRYTAVHRDLEIFLDNPDAPAPAERLDPAIMFTGVEMWRLR